MVINIWRCNTFFCMTLSKTPGWIQNIIVLRRRTLEYEYFIELMYFIACPSNYSRIAIGRVLYRLNAAEANLHSTLLLFPSELRVSDLKRHRNCNTNLASFMCIHIHLLVTILEGNKWRVFYHLYVIDFHKH